MRGTFTTTKYASVDAFLAESAYEQMRSHNAFVDVGLDWMWSMMLGQLRSEDGGLADHLGAARLVVGNGAAEVTPDDERLSGEETAQAEMVEGFPRIAGAVVDEGGRFTRAVFRAAFGPDEANFDWRERGVVTSQGVLIDRSVEDQGRKAPGSVWTLEAVLDLGG